MKFYRVEASASEHVLIDHFTSKKEAMRVARAEKKVLSDPQVRVLRIVARGVTRFELVKIFGLMCQLDCAGGGFEYDSRFEVSTIYGCGVFSI